MQHEGYWSRVAVDRRKALATFAATTAGATAIAACGGSSDKNSNSSNTSQVVVDSTQGKPGGTLKIMLTGPLPGLTVIDRNFVTLYRLAGLAHSGMLAFRWGQESVPITDFSFEPDLAQALPEQPDEQTLIFKMRPNAKFHNGRTVVAEDVRYTYDRHANWDKSAWRSAWQTWFDRADAPDPQTLVVKTKFPFADAVESTAANTDGFIVAKEHEESPQANDKMMGSGPFLFVSAEAPVSWSFKKNPDYYIKPYPYFDEVIAYSTTDPVKRITDFTTRQVHMPWLVYAVERDEIKQQRPDAKLQTHDYPASTIFMRTDKPPFNDKRVRQALSMTIDRKKIRDGATKGEGADDQVFPIAHSEIFGTHQVKDLGSLAKYWTYDPAEARKLLQAAGITKPLEADITHYDPSVVGQWYVDQVTLSQAQWKDNSVANVKLINQLGPQFTSVTRQGNYEGLAVEITGVNSRQRGTSIRQLLYWGPNGEHSGMNTSYVNDPRLSALADKQIRQLKAEERKQTYRDMEPLLAEEQYMIYYSASSQAWFWDPSLRNARMSTQQGSIRYKMRWWFG